MISNMILGAMAWGSALRSSVTSRLAEERGQDLVEYAVLIGGIGILALVAFLAAPLGGSTGMFHQMADKIGACVTFDTTNCK